MAVVGDEELRLADLKVMERRVAERKRRDRFGRWTNRVALLVLVLLYLLGFHSGQVRDDRLARQSDTVRAQAAQLGHQADTIRAQAKRIKRLAEGSNHALCALRRDLEDRVHGGERFLREHPKGIPGIPAKTLQTSIDGQRRTIRALSNLKCR